MRGWLVDRCSATHARDTGNSLKVMAILWQTRRHAFSLLRARAKASHSPTHRGSQKLLSNLRNSEFFRRIPFTVIFSTRISRFSSETLPMKEQNQQFYSLFWKNLEKWLLFSFWIVRFTLFMKFASNHRTIRFAGLEHFQLLDVLVVENFYRNLPDTLYVWKKSCGLGTSLLPFFHSMLCYINAFIILLYHEGASIWWFWHPESFIIPDTEYVLDESASTFTSHVNLPYYSHMWNNHKIIIKMLHLVKHYYEATVLRNSPFLVAKLTSHVGIALLSISPWHWNLAICYFYYYFSLNSRESFPGTINHREMRPRQKIREFCE